MTSLETQLVKLNPIANHEVGYMWRVVASTNPLLNTDFVTAAAAISEEFHVLCTEEDIKAYDELLVEDDETDVIHGALY